MRNLPKIASPTPSPTTIEIIKATWNVLDRRLDTRQYAWFVVTYMTANMRVYPKSDWAA